MDPLQQDSRHAVRRLWRSPAFTLGAIALLAVGIGANTTVFTVVDALIFRSPPWASPERVVRIYQDTDEGAPGTNSFPAYRDMTEYDVFATVAATVPSFMPATWDSDQTRSSRRRSRKPTSCYWSADAWARCPPRTTRC